MISASALAHRAHAREIAPDLAKLSIEELGDIQVTSVSKAPESLGQAPSAIYVITADDIARSGAESLPEILRLAPNVQVYQTSASRYVVTARGLNGAPAAQNFANKLLVLIDGRTVYSPLYSGLYWDMQDVLTQDIARIEVISGPGATLWGSNAVNGVINITTRSSAETQGGLVAASLGEHRRSLSLRYGGKIDEGLTYRVYAKNFLREDTRLRAGGSAHDHWSKPQAGFRFDWTPSASDTLTFQGDGYRGEEAQFGAAAERISGGNLLGRWSRSWANGSQLRVQAYADRARRGGEVDGSGLLVDTYDLDVQHSFTLGTRNEIVWGGGYRVSDYDIDGTESLKFEPASGSLKLFNLFVQDTFTLSPKAKLVLGLKVEDDPYIRPELMPTARLSWTPTSRATLWAAASRAIRSPTPFDRDVVEILGGMRFLVGGPDFRSEKLTAYEAGVRLQPSARASFSIATFYNDYDDLRSIEVTPTSFLPLRWGNLMLGHTYGAEAWGDYQVAPWWRLTGALSYIDQKFRFAPGSSRLVGVNQVGNDPKYQASLRSAMDLGESVTLDLAFRYVSALPDPRIRAYTELDGRLGWNITDNVQVSVSGRNLLHKRHQEYPEATDIPRSVFVGVQWRY